MEILKYKASEIRKSVELRDELCKIYKEMFGENLQTSCENCIADGLFRIKYHITNKKDKKMEKTKECAFRLKEDQVLYVWHMHLTNSNMTDALAVKLLKINRGLLSRFEKYPDNLDEMMGWEEPKEVKKTTEKTEEPKGKLEDIPTVDELCDLLKTELIKKVEGYKNKVAFKESDTKTEIARAYIDRLILDSE